MFHFTFDVILKVTLTMEVLENRRSCRKFIRDEKINKEEVAKIIAAAQNYPCACGNQETDFYICTNRELLDKLSEQLTENIPEFTGYLKNRITELGVTNTIWCDAPIVVFLVANKNRNPESIESTMGEAAMSIIAAAEALGYATLPVLMPANPDAVKYTAKILNLPEESIGLSVALGHARPDWKPEPKEIKSNVKWIE